MAKKRNRITYAVLMGIVVALGLLSRTSITPELICPYLGDILYALLIFVMVGFLFPAKSWKWVGAVALAFCFAIEISQFYHAPWIDVLRHTRLGGLVLGFGFLWSDLFAYTFGVMIGIILEKRVLLKHSAGALSVSHTTRPK